MIVSGGAKQALAVLLTVLIDPQDEVIITAPYWVSYPEMVKLVYGVPVIVHSEDGRFWPRIQDIKAAVSSYTKAIILNSPNNPSGAVYSDAFIGEIVEFCEEKGIFLISDDIYHRLIFDGKSFCPAYRFVKKDLEDSKVIVINGVSKLYAMTGFRIGWTIAPKKIVEVMVNVQAQTTSCSSTISQVASVGALNGVQSGIDSLRLMLQNNRDIMVQELKTIDGVRITKPEGMFYCLPDFRTFNKDSVDLCRFLLNKVQVVTVPGKEFGMEGCLRLSYCGTVKDITEGVARIKWALDPNAPNEISIGGTGYGGEIKKSGFTILNYLLPLEGILSMHCSANVAANGDSALFFGLSGTGKTTLSADPRRRLIGDDEHGWSDTGIFNFENGCYAEVIALSASAEPEIFACTRKYGTILENVIFDPVSRVLDLDDDTRTENTRASYPLDYIANAVPEKMAGHPKNIIMLTCDASGVMPPISRLTPDQAVYHFISGYTAKVSGTEIELGKEPEITFSACFGAPFMVHHPYLYADLLKRKIMRHEATCWLVNTGWTGGPYGVGKRISIRYTRALLDAALEGKLTDVEYYQDPIFGFAVPTTCPEVPDAVLRPDSSWPDKASYQQRYRDLTMRFIDNFKQFQDGCPPEVVTAGPKL